MKLTAYRSTLQLAPLMFAGFSMLPVYAATTDDTLDTVIVTAPGAAKRAPSPAARRRSM